MECHLKVIKRFEKANRKQVVGMTTARVATAILRLYRLLDVCMVVATLAVAMLVQSI
jgi:hypothetical protein